MATPEQLAERADSESFCYWDLIQNYLSRLNVFVAPLGRMRDALRDFAKERQKQILKWGDQTHPCVPAELPGIPSSHAVMLRSIAQEMEHAAKKDCNNAFREGSGTWWHIAFEELCEAGAAPPAKRREELVQLGAVITAWIEDLDARTAPKDS